MNETAKKELLPCYEQHHLWECYQKDLGVEYRQSTDEGKDIGKYAALFDAVAKMPENKYKERMADVLHTLVQEAPLREDYPYVEPSGIHGIRAEREPFSVKMEMPPEDRLLDRVLGGWYGRICGCLLGKPVEGMKTDELHKILKATGNFPMTRYIDREDMTEEIRKGLDYPFDPYPRDKGCMPPDDDTNYMIIAYTVLHRFGRDFTPENVARIWLETQTKYAYCTAERAAYRNFINGFLPPESALYKNPYREWIGAQIRGDVFGYVNPCDPEAAADMAFRDACISHVKNGIYGEMWVSAMLAAAYGNDDVEQVIRRGLAEIPRRSRLYEAVTRIIDRFRVGVTEEECFADIHSRWNQYDSYDWTHTLSNAEIVTACLLYGEKDYGRSVCRAVMTGFDTDCNGATVGSVLGVMLGMSALPAAFTDRICDTLESTLSGFARVSVTDMAKKTLEMIRR